MRKARRIGRGEASGLRVEPFRLGDRNVTAGLPGPEPTIAFTRTCPILRIFDEDRAREFYLDFLGFTPNWEHRFAPDLPLYMEVERAGLILHLSGHHGDGTPGGTVFVSMRGIVAYREELLAHRYKHMRPGIEDVPWGREMSVIDPFGNTLRFCEPD